MKRKIFRKVIKWTGWSIAAGVVFSILLTLTYRFVNPPCTLLMLHRSIGGVKQQAEKKWTPFDRIPQCMIDAAVAGEDNKFAVHCGFDFDALRDAYRHNKTGKRIRGASTITQQMCKNVFLWESRSYVRKALEAWFTVLVELLWSKQRIMEVYLNVIEMGKGIYGIGAAAQFYYRHPAEKLSREEAAMIAVILPSPVKRNPRAPTAYMLQRQQQILSLMRKIGKVEL
ncbi:MAG: monofunctional biosynthetic peptidoglycan transglycosylase [Bacteroidales bacterium]|jgi:monofunctional biosynthetic peptidoglycan transglycosylase|nr:monofunctional biosynthetic peptidoglycan transglycosylase [Bacteroidales bacterium]